MHKDDARWECLFELVVVVVVMESEDPVECQRRLWRRFVLQREDCGEAGETKTSWWMLLSGCVFVSLKRHPANEHEGWVDGWLGGQNDNITTFNARDHPFIWFAFETNPVKGCFALDWGRGSFQLMITSLIRYARYLEPLCTSKLLFHTSFFALTLMPWRTSVLRSNTGQPLYLHCGDCIVFPVASLFTGHCPRYGQRWESRLMRCGSGVCGGTGVFGIVGCGVLVICLVAMQRAR